MDKCPGCGEEIDDIVYADDGKIISNPNYTLVADWIFHSKCWDEMVERYPTDDGGSDA
jgi:enhancing lycopene biosynthesis protein 2